MNFAKRAGVGLAALSVVLVAAPVQAAELPCSTAKLIVPWGAGGGTDTIIRALAQEMELASRWLVAM